MSQDEIVFDEVRYREPERRCRPDRDRRFACLAYELPGPDDLPVFLDRRTADAIERHALRDTSVELGGILLGKECLDDRTGLPFVWVTESLEAKHYENTQASFTYTHDSWEEITRDRERLHSDLDVVGWYHTHPDFGIFLSGHDLFIQRHFFAQPLQVAYVVDPIRQTRGFFQWRGGNLAQVGGYYLTADRGDRIALARLVNDLENLPNSEPAAGAFSPRLEAELIAMLHRPPTAPSTTAERTLVAALFGMLGMLAGVLLVLAAFWLNQVTQGVQDQGARLEKLEASLERSVAGQRLALEALLDASQSKEHDPDVLMSRYNKTARALDQQATINNALTARVRDFDEANARLKDGLDSASKLADRYERDAKDAPVLREKLAALESEHRTQAGRLTEAERVAGTLEGKKTRELLRRYDRTWYAAVVGWGVALVLALGLLAAFGLRPLPESETASAPPAPRPTGAGEEPPPHHIT